MRLAILGASGFIASRAIEMFHLGHLAEVRPIVRTFGGMSRLARFNLDCRIADALDRKALMKAFENCDVVLHAAHGQMNVIEGSITPVYRAACEAGVKRIVYLSSASVHGRSPPPGTDERSPLSDRQRQEYNNRKVRAERQLNRQRERGSVEVVALRPGIVFGPRDRWITGIASDMLSGTAYLVDGGTGICNSIYVDNLIHAIHLALTADHVDREAFLVSDAETVTWADIYKRIAKALGRPLEQIHFVSRPAFRRRFEDRVNFFRGLKATQSILPIVPASLKRVAKAALAAWPEPPTRSQWSSREEPAPMITEEMADLHQCRYKLPPEKAKRTLGYEPIVSFEEGFRRTIGWLKFAGFDILDEDQCK